MKIDYNRPLNNSQKQFRFQIFTCLAYQVPFRMDCKILYDSFELSSNAKYNFYYFFVSLLFISDGRQNIFVIMNLNFNPNLIAFLS